ncbi:MAG: hypothetical protein ACJATV_001717 [Granulosicoccus sp.]|jgi:hypothetical protein
MYGGSTDIHTATLKLMVSKLAIDGLYISPRSLISIPDCYEIQYNGGFSTLLNVSALYSGISTLVSGIFTILLRDGVARFKPVFYQISYSMTLT